MRFIECKIPGPLVIDPRVFSDERGFFMESWNARVFEGAGLDVNFVQDNHSHSQKGVLRGIHFQNPGSQGKLVRVVSGAVFDVAVDLRRSSAHFGEWIGVELNSENRRLFWIPEGFGHGFLTLRDDTDFLYKCTASYDPELEHTLAWDDPDIAVEWPLNGFKPIVSKKDSMGLSLDEIEAFS